MLKTIIGDGIQPAGRIPSPISSRSQAKGNRPQELILGRRRCISLGCYTGACPAAGPSRSWAIAVSPGAGRPGTGLPGAGLPRVSGRGVGWAAGKGPGMSLLSLNRQDAALSRFC